MSRQAPPVGSPSPETSARATDDQAVDVTQGATAQPSRPPRIASRRLTSATMTAGVLLGGVCFAITLAAEVLGMATDGGPMADLPALADGLLAFRPWAWASLGTYVVVATPVISLGATAIEYAMVHDRRSTGLALLVVAVLALSGLVAWLG